MAERTLFAWAPATLLFLGGAALFQVGNQRALPLRAPLASLPAEVAGFRGQDLELPADQLEVAGVTEYLMRVYREGDRGFSLYVGYYNEQTQGKTIHSPRNCLPGAGWEPISSGTRAVAVGDSSFAVNRYILGKDSDRALVYYWYQGRGRVSADEYQVKWELLRDKVTRRRSEEALVRIVVPITAGLEAADALAEEALRAAVMPLFAILPGLDGPGGGA